MTTVQNVGTDLSQARRGEVARLFDETRRRLVETGTRNRLVHVNRANTRGNVINVVNERSDEIHEILRGSKAMRFLALGRDESDDDEVHLVTAADEPAADRYTDVHLETRLGPDALQKKLLKIAREAQTAEEESGVNILYLALGFLTWFEDRNSGIKREAPLVLLPVELVRNPRTSTYDIRARDEDILTNLPLQQRLKEDFGIDLPEIDGEEDWKPSSYFERVEAVISSHDRWQVDRDAIQLGFFSFSKLLMYRDLDIESWPDEALADHPLTRGLLYEGFAREQPMFGPEDRLDDLLPPERIFHVVDADASQAKVVEEVRSGRNLVVQGPPGTGKSQTITNIIAAAAKDGKRVLFVAEKMAALSVVHDRLVKVGLRDICLELHSRTANKKLVLAELARTISQAAAIPQMPDSPHSLTSIRDRLNSIAEALHEPIGSTGETAFSVLGRQVRYIGMNATPPVIDAGALLKLTRTEEVALVDTIERYGELLADEGVDAPHPFEGAKNLDLQPVELARLATVLTNAKSALEELAAAVEQPMAALGLSLPVTLEMGDSLVDLLSRLEGLPQGTGSIAVCMLDASDPARLRELLHAGSEWRTEFDAQAPNFTDAAFTHPVAGLRGPLVAGCNSFFARLGGAYRSASRELAGLLRSPLPKAALDRLALVDALSNVRSKRTIWETDQAYGERILGDVWRGERSDFPLLISIAGWCDKLSHATLKVAPLAACDMAASSQITPMLRRLIEATGIARAKLDAATDFLHLDPAAVKVEKFEQAEVWSLVLRIENMAVATDRYAGWVQLARMYDRMTAAGLTDLAERMRNGSVSGPDAIVELRFARAEGLWRHALEQSPVLRELPMEKRHELVTTFGQLERERLKDNVTEILAGHLAQVPQGAQGEMGVIRSEIGKKARHLAIRRLFERAGTAIQRIKPVLLMSPISVAQYLPPNALSFDLLVIDEASQVRPEDALGAIARANQIVVVGDQKQLPPSSFFDRLAANDDADEDEPELLAGAAKVAAMESVLTLCEARGLGSRMLEWHYRSRDPSLIKVSNREFYDDGLILPPSPLQADPEFGLCFTQVAGVYDKGGKRDNRKEGEAIVARVSTRRTEILEALAKGDRGSPRERELAALATRQAKNPEFSPEQRQAQWLETAERVGFDGRDLIASAIARNAQQQTIWSKALESARGIGERGLAIASAMGLTPRDGDPLVPERLGRLDPRAFAAAQAVAAAARDLGEREAAFDRSDLIRAALERGGPVTVADVEARIAHLAGRGLLLGGERLMTTESALALEHRVVALAHDGRDAVSPLAMGVETAPRLQQAARDLALRRLNPGQEQAGVDILQSTDRVILVQGGAGVGKSAALMPVAHLLKAEGRSVFALAHAGRTARDFGARLDAPASTVDSFLGRFGRVLDGSASTEQMARARDTLSGSVIMVDEASQIGSERLARLIDLSNRMGVARLILAGDVKQLPAIEAGKPFELLQTHAVSTSTITENLRARSPQMQALNAALENADMARAFEVLKPDTREVPFTKGPETAARLWAGLSTDERAGTLLLASGRAMRTAANVAVQQERIARGELTGQGQRFDTLDRVTITKEGARQMKGYQPGRIVEFRTSLPSQRFARGDRGEVRGADDGKVQLRMADGTVRPFQPDRLPRNLAHDAVSIFEPKAITLFEGDRIRWTDNDRERGLLNGDIANIEKLDRNMASIRTANGDRHTLASTDPMLERLDLAYAVNVHVAQGMTATNGIILMSEREKMLNSTRSFLVAITRIAEHATLVVDSARGLERSVAGNAGDKTSAIEVANSSVVRKPPERDITLEPAAARTIERDIGR